MPAQDMAGKVEMGWWPRRRRGRHAADSTPRHPMTQRMADAAQALRESIEERPKIDKLAEAVRREFGARS
jgi:hypothetical protein